VAQQPAVEELEMVDVFPEPFSSLGGLRPLPDEALLVSDRIEKSVYRISFLTGEYDMLGHNGQGPMEYDMPLNVFPSTAQSSVVLDMGNMRLARMNPHGEITDTYPLMSGMTFRMPSAGDGLGNLYYSDRGSVRVQSGGASATLPATEAPLTRWNPETDVTDTVAVLMIPPEPEMGGAIRIEGGQISGMPAPRPFRPRDAWAVGADGRIGIARAEPYRVEWVEPDGTSLVGPTVDYARVPIGRRERQLWADRRSQQSGTVAIMGGSGGGSQTIRMPAPDLDEVEFPEFFPAFTEEAATVSAEGDLWVRRHESAGSEGTLYDVFDDRGVLVRRVRLPEGRVLLGFSPRSLYAYSSDEDDLQWLEQYEI
jgi:hypothetical protein